MQHVKLQKKRKIVFKKNVREKNTNAENIYMLKKEKKKKQIDFIVRTNERMDVTSWIKVYGILFCTDCINFI